MSYPVAMVLLTALSLRRRRTRVDARDRVGWPVWNQPGVRRVVVLRRARAQGPMSLVSPLTAILVAGVPVGVGRGAGGAAVRARRHRHRPGVDRGRPGQSGGSGDDAEMCDPRTPIHGEGRVADGRFGPGVRAELRAHRPGARRGPALAAGVRQDLGQRCSSWSSPRSRATSSCPTGVPLRLALAAGVLDTVANVAMLLALQASMLSLAECADLAVPGGARSGWRCVVLKETGDTLAGGGMVLALASVGIDRRRRKSPTRPSVRSTAPRWTGCCMASDAVIRELTAAVERSPDAVELRLHLADLLIQQGSYRARRSCTAAPRWRRTPPTRRR